MARISSNEIKDIFVSNLTSIMESRDIDGAELARLIGKEKQSVYAWIKKRSFPSASNIQLLVDKLGITTDDLLSNHDAESSGFVDVPIYGSIAAGKPIEMMEADDSFQIPTKIHEMHPDAFLLRVEGESMNRKLPNGCYALVDPSRTEPVIDGNAYAVCVNGYDATIKRVRKLNNGFELAPDSTDPTYRPMVYDYGIEGTDTITIIGEVVWYTIPFDFDI